MGDTVIVPTCDRDKFFSDLAIEGVKKFWPGVTVVEMHDKNKKLEADVPDDIRALVDKIPYLKSQIDAPFLADGGDFYMLDADCFTFATPDELMADYSYQGMACAPEQDFPWGLDVWEAIGHTFPITRPLFCAGIYKAPSKAWTENQDLIFEYIRQCVKMRYFRPDWDFMAVTFEQNLAAGLWRMNCKDNPLPAKEYPVNLPNDGQKIFHACSFKSRYQFPPFVEQYKKMLDK